MHVTIILSFSVALQLLLGPCANGVPEHGWTYRDTEEDEFDAQNGAQGSGEQSQSEMAWVSYGKSGSVHSATVSEVNRLLEYVGMQPNVTAAGPRASLVSFTGVQMEDGPEKEDSIKRTNPRPAAERSSELPLAGEVLDMVPSTNFYPEFAIGILENGCTAFLIGPRHALTAAHCVYDFNASSFNENLNLWRGRNLDTYLGLLAWSEVIVPINYFLSGVERDDWALIIYNEISASPVWLKIGYSKRIYNAPFTAYSYLSNKPYGVMYSTICRSQTENSAVHTDPQLINIWCSTVECFDGGPVLRGYDFQRSKMPVANGIVLSNASYSLSHNTVVFQPDLFWSLCYHMAEHGFNAQCRIEE